VAPAPAGLYAFFQLQGQGDSLAVAKRLVQEAGLGLAPGNAFHDSADPQMQGWLRWCFASRDLSRLVQGVDRLERWLSRSHAN
jgi:aspartate/methionine/tyrosine aminotransferase